MISIRIVGKVQPQNWRIGAVIVRLNNEMPPVVKFDDHSVNDVSESNYIKKRYSFPFAGRDENRRWFEWQLTRVSAKATIAEDIRYALNHWDGLTRFLDDGRIELDTNIVAVRWPRSGGGELGLRWFAHRRSTDALGLGGGALDQQTRSVTPTLARKSSRRSYGVRRPLTDHPGPARSGDLLLSRTAG
jgi:hypothetical protein